MSVWVSIWVSDKVSDKLSVKVSDKESDNVSDRVSEWVNEEVFGLMCDWVSVWLRAGVKWQSECLRELQDKGIVIDKYIIDIEYYSVGIVDERVTIFIHFFLGK